MSNPIPALSYLKLMIEDYEKREEYGAPILITSEILVKIYLEEINNIMKDIPSIGDKVELSFEQIRTSVARSILKLKELIDGL